MNTLKTENTWILAIVLVCSLPMTTALACGTGHISADGYEIATLAHAHNHWLEGKRSPIPFLFLDVRTPREYAQGHVPGAINIPVDELEEHLRKVPRDKQVYAYCEAGVRAARAGKLLAQHGYTNIEVVPPSMHGWRQAGYPVQKGGHDE